MKGVVAGVIAIVFAASIAGPSKAVADNDDAVIRIMTQNLYEGTSFSELLLATTPPAFLAAVTTTRQNILATKPAVRAAAIAREIARERPDLVALQEAAILRTALVPVTTPAKPVTTVEFDQLELLLAELKRLGHPYQTISILPNLDAQAPSSSGASVRITVRTVIIARSNTDDVQLSNVQAQEYLDFASFPTPVGVSIPNQRGWTSVDVKVNGRGARFITTHLDQSVPLGALQISELLQSAVNSTGGAGWRFQCWSQCSDRPEFRELSGAVEWWLCRRVGGEALSEPGAYLLPDPERFRPHSQLYLARGPCAASRRHRHS